jgi:hypothetical protein
MAYSDTFITIHLVKDLKAPALDDTVCIKKNLEDSVFEVTFKDNGEPLMHRAHEMTRDNVCDYVYLLLKNLTMDEDGYKSIQVSLPAMPRLIMSTSNLHELYYRQHFLELVENGLNIIDKVEKLPVKKVSEKKTEAKANLCSSTNDSCRFRNSCCTSSNCREDDVPNPLASPIYRYFE